MLRFSRFPLACFAALVASGAAPHSARAHGLPLAGGADCSTALQQTADSVSALPGATPSEVTDRLQTDYDEASSLADSDPAACLAIVRRMNEVVRRYHTLGDATGGGTAGSAPSTTRNADDRTTANPTPRAERAAREGAAESRRERLERAATQDAEDARTVTAYAQAFKAYRAAMHAIAEAAQTPPAALTPVDKPIEEIVVILDRMEDDILVDDDVDALHAKLEDAFRRIDALRKIVDREWQRWLVAEARRNAEEKKLKVNEDDPISALVPLVVLRNYSTARDRYLAVQKQLDDAEFAAKQVRNKIDPLLHWYQPFLDMKPGYKQAYKAAYARHQDEQEALDAKCNGMALGACAQLIRTTNVRQRHELDAIFDRYVIRK